MQRSTAWDVNRVRFRWRPAAPRASSFPELRRAAGRPLDGAPSAIAGSVPLPPSSRAYAV